MAKRRDYERPPVREALCSIAFEPQPWNVATPGLLFEQIRGQYPSDPQEQHEANFTVAPDSVSVGQTARRFLYEDQRGHVLIASPQILSVNQVPPNAGDYEGWEALKHRFLAGLDAYIAVLGNEMQVTRVNVRYINIIDITSSGNHIGLPEHFAIPVPGMQREESLNSFLIRTETALSEPNTGLTLTFASVPTAPHLSREEAHNVATFMLDLDVYRSFALPPTRDEISSVLETLHEIENTQFESLITDQTRMLFG